MDFLRGLLVSAVPPPGSAGKRCGAGTWLRAPPCAWSSATLSWCSLTSNFFLSVFFLGVIFFVNLQCGHLLAVLLLLLRVAPGPQTPACCDVPPGCCAVLQTPPQLTCLWARLSAEGEE